METVLIFLIFLCVGRGMVLDSSTSSTMELSSFCTASPDSTAWVARAYTFSAPNLFRIFAASVMLPAVSIMSSMRKQVFPLTSPITCSTAATLWFCRLLSTIAIGTPSIWASVRARAAPPASGETMTASLAFLSMTYWAKNGSRSRLSLGMSKKPWTCGTCSSKKMTRLMPATWIMFATSLAVMGSRDLVFLSCREYP